MKIEKASVFGYSVCTTFDIIRSVDIYHKKPFDVFRLPLTTSHVDDTQVAPQNSEVAGRCVVGALTQTKLWTGVKCYL